MKISELSRRSGVSLPTIKFYIREGLLPAGHSTARNQAEYGLTHLERLALIRALKDDAGISIAAIGRALRIADSTPREFVTAAIDAIGRPAGPAIDERSAEFRQALAFILEAVHARGWSVDARDRSVRDAARAVALARRSFPEERPEEVASYLEAMELLARTEIPGEWRPQDAREAALRYALLGTVLFEPLLLALRRVAHVARSRALEAASGAADERRAASAPPRLASPAKPVPPRSRPKRRPPTR